MNAISVYNFPQQVAWRVLNLLIERKAMLYPTGTVFYVWQRGDRVIVAFDPSAVDTERVSEDFAHRLATRLHGRRVVRTNSRGLFLQVGVEIPAAPRALNSTRMDLMGQPSPYHLPIGMTQGGGLWISLVEGDSFLIGGSRNGGKSGLIHAWIQALLHGGRTLVYAWDKKNGAEFGRYVGRRHFNFRIGAMQMLEEIQGLLAERERKLTLNGQPNILMYNAAHPEDEIQPIAVVTDEAADLPDGAKERLNQMIRLYRHVGFHPVVATNQPTVAEMFGKTNLSTRICFRVPHHSDSITMLGYKGAESLPEVRGRGLILWGGKFIEFQSFEVEYPLPSREALQAIQEERVRVGNEEGVNGEDEERIRRVRELVAQGRSDAAIVREVWGVSGGGRFYKLVETVKGLRSPSSSSDASSSNEKYKG